MNGMENLGQIFHNRIHEVNNATKGLPPELGEITTNLGLQVPSVKNTISKEDYLIEKSTSVQVGDRVLIIWCGMEPVISAVLREGAEEPVDPNAPAKLVNILPKAFPVGIILATSTEANPGTALSGTWEDSGDIFILLADGTADRELYTWEKKASDESTAIEVQKDAVNIVLAKAYPVGTIVISISETNPGVLLGGTWKESGDSFVLSSDGESKRPLYTWEKVADTITAETTEEISEAILQLRPVGSIYFSAAESNPGEFLGGTWIDSGDVFLLSADGTAIRTLHTWERTA